MEEAPILKAVHLAVDLGGWKVDAADPLKQPYTAENAAMAAAERYGITDPEQVATIRRVVEARRAEEPTRNA